MPFSGTGQEDPQYSPAQARSGGFDFKSHVAINPLLCLTGHHRILYRHVAADLPPHLFQLPDCVVDGHALASTTCRKSSSTVAPSARSVQTQTHLRNSSSIGVKSAVLLGPGWRGLRMVFSSRSGKPGFLPSGPPPPRLTHGSKPAAATENDCAIDRGSVQGPGVRLLCVP